MMVITGTTVLSKPIAMQQQPSLRKVLEPHSNSSVSDSLHADTNTYTMLNPANSELWWRKEHGGGGTTNR
jgi:hypothetical protein